MGADAPPSRGFILTAPAETVFLSPPSIIPIIFIIVHPSPHPPVTAVAIRAFRQYLLVPAPLRPPAEVIMAKISTHLNRPKKKSSQ
jgi:hypothetical protein